MKRIHSANKTTLRPTKYLFVKTFSAPTNKGEVEMIEYWTIDLIRNLITGKYWFERSRWVMFLNDGHREKFQLSA